MNDEMSMQEDTLPLAPMGGTGLIRMLHESVQVLARGVSRDIKAIQKELDAELAAIGPEGAEKWFFTLKFRQWDEDQKKEVEVLIQGPSIRAAEAIQRAYGYLFVAGVVLEERMEDFLVGGICLDLVKGNIVAKQKRIPKMQWSKTQKKAFPVKAHKLERDIDAAKSKAVRDSIFQTVPESIRMKVFQNAKALASTAPFNLERMIARFSLMGVIAAQLEKYVGHPLEQCTDEDKINLRGLFTALQSGEATIAQVFGDAPPVESEPTMKVDETDSMAAGPIYAAHKKIGKSRDSVDAEFTALVKGGMTPSQAIEELRIQCGLAKRPEPEQAKAEASTATGSEAKKPDAEPEQAKKASQSNDEYVAD